MKRAPDRNNLRFTRIIGIAAGLVLLSGLFTVVFARVGGGQSYGGGSRGGSGGGLGGLIFLIIRLLVELTIYHPFIGIPIDIIVIGYIVYVLVKPKKTEPSTCSAPSTGVVPTTTASQLNVTQAFNQLRRFDPNFSEIIFTDFCYALYAKAHNSRGHRDRLD